MSDQQLLDILEDDSLGSVQIVPEVLEVIAGFAATEVDGVKSMHGSFATGVAEKFGRKSHGKGVRVELTDNGAIIDIYVILTFGKSIPEVAAKLQTNIKQNVHTMTSIQVEEVNVHVAGIQMENQEIV
ncbi:Asp23/Gls24 family envelope stress response protein [Oceanobacillus jeddahense]|uniref:Asp23/Gls24 family envelope stress response protein n=1 Tax=Oceanobacillus jeddahense TaxID=1462527 RepID=A0ABY5JP97_9BACI|nr:Asp23/Gls24 family envelope stress response protein [Oceanobacillus jeddahense]UUI01302.1 Asp23/Gls24 family envelope stress response protein [Oceanobacillus jeddahense]